MSGFLNRSISPTHFAVVCLFVVLFLPNTVCSFRTSNVHSNSNLLAISGLQTSDRLWRISTLRLSPPRSLFKAPNAKYYNSAQLLKPKLALYSSPIVSVRICSYNVIKLIMFNVGLLTHTYRNSARQSILCVE